MDTLMIELKRNTAEPLYDQLYSGIKTAILTKQIKVNDKLPSKRKLAAYLSVSRTTVEQAYDQLMAEGYIDSEPRKGFFVQGIEELTTEKQEKQAEETAAPVKLPYSVDFNPARVDAGSFPFAVWRKLARSIFDETNPALLEPADPQGDAELRAEIAAYLYQSRGVLCRPGQIVVGSGTEQLMPLLIRLLDPASVYAFENPGYPLTHTIFSNYERKAVPISVDTEGLAVEELERTAAHVAYVTPSHQFPTGAVMSASRRSRLLKWAAAAPDRYIVEDDFDSEFRYTGRPIPALQGMDRSGRVIYISTFSKSLMPSLRMAYMVLPDSLLQAYRKTFLLYASTVPKADQQLVARFMKEGHFTRHLNRMRTLYRKKRETLVASLTAYGPSVSISGDQAGMHAVVTVRTPFSESELAARALDAGIRVYSLQNYDIFRTAAEAPQILLGFGGLPEQAIPPAVETLMAAWNIKKQTVHFE